RDVDQKSAISYIEETENKIEEIRIGQFASISGRYYGLDRDNRRDREEKAYNAMSNGEGPVYRTAVEGAELIYKDGLTDEVVVPFIVKDEERGVENNGVNSHDAMIFFNFRPDRAAQLSQVYTNETFEGFEIKRKLEDLYFVTFTNYSDDVFAEVAFKPVDIKNTIGEVAEKNNLNQLRIAETEKF